MSLSRMKFSHLSSISEQPLNIWRTSSDIIYQVPCDIGIQLALTFEMINIRSGLKFENTLIKKAQQIEDKISIGPEKRLENIKLANRKAQYRYAKKLGLKPLPHLETEIRKKLNEKIVIVVKKKKLRHYQVAHSIGTSRQQITRVMNRKVKKISTDLMLKILATLGINISFHFNQ